AVGIAGRAAPLAFGIGSLVAFAAGYSYIKLALCFHSDGASFTYLEKAFPKSPNIPGIAGWIVIVGYVGTLALYAFTFGAYGAHLLGDPGSGAARIVLSGSVLLFFMTVNLLGAKTSGTTEDLIVYTKVMLLGIFVVAGSRTVSANHLTPLFDRGPTSPFVAGALIFVAFEGFQLITNAVMETRDPDVNVPRGIYGSIAITSFIYIGVAVVAIGNMDIQTLVEAEEYALAVAAKPALGAAGAVLVDIAALLATSSAINATLFGASRMLAEMAGKNRVPQAFNFKNRTAAPWVAVVVITGLGLLFTLVSGLDTIATFSSLTFLLVSIAVSVANYRLRRQTRSSVWLIALGFTLMTVSVSLLLGHLWTHQPFTLIWVAALFGGIALSETFFFSRVTLDA
ncbi:hypothetical protein MNBD_NITROSPINAE04-1738, partial [hydrothermal vent metagenome]